MPVQSLSSHPFASQNKEIPSFTKTPELINAVCEYLATDDLVSVSAVNRLWNSYLEARAIDGIPMGVLAKRQDQLREFAFGAHKWKRYFGKVDRLPLPLTLYDILNRPCPIYPEKTVKETHILFLVPQTVNGEPLTLDSLQTFAKAPKEGSEGYATQYQSIWWGGGFKFADGSTNHNWEAHTKFAYANKSSCWALMSKDVIPGSKNKYLHDQRLLIPSSSPDCTYEVPDILEATVGIVTYFVRTGQRLYSDTPLTYTRCIPLPSYRNNAVVGGFDASGLDICPCIASHIAEETGLAILRKFSAVLKKSIEEA